MPAIIPLLKQSFKDFNDDRAPMLGAALAYYTLFSIAPILVVATGVAGLVFGEQAVQGQLSEQLDDMVGAEGARAVEMMLANMHQKGGSIIAVVIGTVTLILGATTAFLQLQAALNTVWEVRRQGGGIKGMLLQRVTGFGMVLGIGFLLMVSLVVSAVLSGLQDQLDRILPGGELLWQGVNAVVSLGVFTVLFALIYRYLPDVEIEWRDVWFGGLVTAVLFTIGKFLIGLYLGRSSVGSGYGAAGSLVVLMVWIYYSAQIVLFGAEVTQANARMKGRRIVPSKGAVRRAWGAANE
jgi:membrane protein